MKLDDQLNKLEDDLFNDLYDTKDGKRQEEIFRQAIKNFEGLYQDFEDKSDYYYTLGYIKYQYSNKHVILFKEIKKDLLMALEIDSNHDHARLTLGSLYYDNKKYEQAIDQFERIDLNFFIEIEQLWRAILTRELLVLSKIHLSKKIGMDIYHSFQTLVEDRIKIEESKEASLSYPYEIARVIIWYLKKQRKINELDKKVATLTKTLIELYDIPKNLSEEYIYLSSVKCSDKG